MNLANGRKLTVQQLIDLLGTLSEEQRQLPVTVCYDESEYIGIELTTKSLSIYDDWGGPEAIELRSNKENA